MSQDQAESKLGFNEHLILAALNYLLEHHDPERGSIVLIEESGSGKFVQFGPGWSIEMDVPHVALSKDEADRAYEFFATLGKRYLIEYDAPDPKTGQVRHGAAFNFNFGQFARAAARAAVAFFHEVYLFPANVGLTIRWR